MKAITAISVFVFACCFCTVVTVQADFSKAQEYYLLKDYERALQEYKKVDDPRSMYQIGYMYDNGEGVPQDTKEAAQWYLKAAEKGHARAQYRMGLFYATGTGVEKNMKEAEKWYRKAAGQGIRPAKDALKKIEGVK